MWEVEIAEFGSEKQAEVLADGWEPFGVYAMTQSRQSQSIVAGGPMMIQVGYKPVILYRREVIDADEDDALDIWPDDVV